MTMLEFGQRPLIMGVLNATPDSFSGDGSTDPAVLLERARVMVSEGADILDVGGESTRPGALPVNEGEELSRVLPVVSQLAQQFPGLTISIDTTKPRVAEAALEAGATIVNDVSALRDPALAEIALHHHAWLVLTHNCPESAAKSADTILQRTIDSLAGLRRRAQAVGLPVDRLIADPGLGFGKTAAENLELMRRTGDLKDAVQLPLLVGASRKFGRQGIEGTAACVAITVFLGADIVRVHDVGAMRAVTRVATAIRAGAAHVSDSQA